MHSFILRRYAVISLLFYSKIPHNARGETVKKQKILLYFASYLCYTEVYMNRKRR